MEPPKDNEITPDRLNKLLADLHEATAEAARIDEAVNTTIARAYADQAVEPARLSSTVDLLSPPHRRIGQVNC